MNSYTVILHRIGSLEQNVDILDVPAASYIVLGFQKRYGLAECDCGINHGIILDKENNRVLKIEYDGTFRKVYNKTSNDVVNPIKEYNSYDETMQQLCLRFSPGKDNNAKDLDTIIRAIFSHVDKLNKKIDDLNVEMNTIKVNIK